MQKIKVWNWDKKERTMIRFIKNGDIFCFRLGEKGYCFGRIITKCDFGHLAEIFDYISDRPTIDVSNVEKASRLSEPIVLDSYSLFDRKMVGDWRIVGHQEGYITPDYGDIILTFGIDKNWKKMDLYGNVTQISEEEHLKYIPLSPRADYWVKRFIHEHISELKEI